MLYVVITILISASTCYEVFRRAPTPSSCLQECPARQVESVRQWWYFPFLIYRPFCATPISNRCLLGSLLKINEKSAICVLQVKR